MRKENLLFLLIMSLVGVMIGVMIWSVSVQIQRDQDQMEEEIVRRVERARIRQPIALKECEGKTVSRISQENDGDYGGGWFTGQTSIAFHFGKFVMSV